MVFPNSQPEFAGYNISYPFYRTTIRSLHMIGIFDSGVGGMTVARAVEKRLPDVSTLYLGDLARAPYGPKSDSAIIDYSLENSKFLVENGAKVIVIACNSASSVATDIVREEFKIPVLEVITPAVEQAVSASRFGRIGIIGTRATTRSGIYEHKIKTLRPDFTVYSQSCPLLVPLVEEGWINKRETKMILRRYLHPLKERQIDSLILGCTHYPLLKHLIQPRIGKKVHLIDSSNNLANSLNTFLTCHPQLVDRKEPVQRLHFTTDITETAQKCANAIFQRSIILRQP